MNKNRIRWIIVIASFIIISLILWNTYIFFQNFKGEERKKMENWSTAETQFLRADDSNIDGAYFDFTVQILNNNTTTPIIAVNNDGSITTYKNVDSLKMESPEYVQKLINRFKNENRPIEVYVKGEVISTIYYGNSPLLNKLKYYPMALLLIIFLFGAVVFFFYRSSKTAEQNKLWTGMAKETAHQIGTPLSSLVGWAEILRSENVNPSYITEIEKDISRLQTITERFSKIGSMPTLERTDIVQETIESFDYLKSRSSDLIDFEISVPDQVLYVDLNRQLYGWTIENLVKNAIDAMKGKGHVSLTILSEDKHVKINVSDTGKGIPKYNFSKIFEPGYTSKKRGWGLGLSLAKRIIEDYHQGRIRVLHSEIDKGTTMQISLKLV